MTLGGPSIQRILGVLILLTGVALIVVSRAGSIVGVAVGVILLAVGFWLSYIRNEIAKIRRNGSERQ